VSDPAPQLLVAEPGEDFALIDSGHGRKLERCGPFRFIRPEPQAMWAPRQPDWQADGEFVGGSDEEGGGRWNLAPNVPAAWPIRQAGVALYAQCTPFRHLGFFPDMAPHWAALAGLPAGADMLNLFGYTGVASLVAAQAGARVVHVDASRKAVEQARANAALAGLTDKPIRWITEDARKFVAREVRRGRRYDAIMLDPPKFGRGPEGEVWDLTRDLLQLVADCARLLDANSRFLILTTYAIRLSPVALFELLRPFVAHLPGTLDCGDMAIREESGRAESGGRLLPTAIFARWRA